MSDASLHNRAVALYTVPFRYKCGYIFDANGHMAADMGDVGVSVARVRGWGRIQHMPEPEALQDKIGEMIALAMTEYWRCGMCVDTWMCYEDATYWHPLPDPPTGTERGLQS